MAEPPGGSLDDLRNEMMAIGEELLAALDQEHQLDSIGPDPKGAALKKLHAARELVDRLTMEYGKSIKRYRMAMEDVIPPAPKPKRRR